MMRNSSDTIDAIIFTHLDDKGPSFRTDLEDAVTAAGYSAALCTRRLRILREDALKIYIVSSRINRTDAHLYSMSALSNADLEHHQRRLDDRHAFLQEIELGRVCEQYTRSIFRSVRECGADWLGRIPNTVGYHKLKSNRRGDLVIGLGRGYARHKAALIECKNEREHFMLTSSVFAKLMQSALQMEQLPVLATAHIGARAERFCKDAGIAVLHFGKRIIPRASQNAARRLWGKAQADRIFHAIRPGRPFADRMRISRLSLEHWQTVASEEWLLAASERWHKHRKVLPLLADALEHRDWGRFNSAYARIALG